MGIPSMGAAYDQDDDGFDWEAAVTEMENISLLAKEQDKSNIREPYNQFADCVLKNKEKVKGRKPLLGNSYGSHPQAKTYQKTLLNFVKRNERQPKEKCTTTHNGDEGVSKTEESEFSIDPVAAKTWIYPVNVPMRDYQFSIVQTALFSNTLVSLPTGLGKTLIAAVVMYNFFRWFPGGKIVFTAPSRPLVMQQIEACHNIVGIPQEWTIDMTGHINPMHRLDYWQVKRVFFVTPQVLEKDIDSGACRMKSLVCLVVDEAHRASGNYSYCVVVKKIMEASVKLRILALTATPGSKQATIQAVVDNLHMSCLEYRNENDPDVCQYTHSRKIELIQVAMNAESVTIKDAFLGVLQPVVNRLYALQVFYSRDVVRLTPFELISARDKFRQAPPATLNPAQFGEVEGYFGVAITLFHIFKLLFSHGVRPAFEMLRQKLQGGSFARLMGRNEKLQHVKFLMQQNIGNGAPSPKLVKVEDLILEHFNLHDPSMTRVIIFTNFRESVKDILDSLRKLGNNVKAMEFIGQNSGKSSKGQSQRVQQAVLQKFRAGGYNIIVATSIGEEGLDIMEVDLVICFDANISPLRMIQRMGRTGRKRDGRVVVLASEGAEVQGYLKKQAKGDAVSRHMHNGGVNSFNFHTSPRMVPHSFKPEVCLLELAIERFVPRGKKRSNSIDTSDTGIMELTREERAMLNMYFEPSAASVGWNPSLISFPQCQRFPTRIHKVRHSFRTTSMLIDTLQVLLQDGKTKADLGNEAALLLDPRDNNYVHNNEGSKTDDKALLRDVDGEAAEKSEPVDSSGDKISFDDIEMKSQQTSKTIASGAAEFKTKGVKELSDFQWMVSPAEESDPPCNIPCQSITTDDYNVRNGTENTEQGHDFVQAQTTEGHSTPSPTRMYDGCPSSRKESLHRCLFSKGVVSVNAAGYVQIKSPPSLPLPDGWREAFCEHKLMPLLKSTPISTLFSMAADKNKLTDLQLEESLFPSVTISVETQVLRSDEFVVSTPEEIITHEPHGNNHVDVTVEDCSPRLSSLAEQGIVPASPTFICTPINNKEEFSPIVRGLNPTQKLLSMPAITFSIKHGKEASTNQGYIEKSIRLLTSPASCVMAKHEKMDICSIPTADSPFPGEPHHPLKIQEPSQKSVEVHRKTPIQHICKSSSGNWQLTVTDDIASVYKPRKFKRLRKGHRPQKCSPQKSKRKEFKEKQKQSHAVQSFIDDEAEVSSDEDVSGDEDVSDEEGKLEDFIDDRMEPSAETQQTNDPIDMMAVYRKSLLTQSPLDGFVNSRAHFTGMSITPDEHKSANMSSGIMHTEDLHGLNSGSCQSFARATVSSLATPISVNRPSKFSSISSAGMHCRGNAVYRTHGGGDEQCISNTDKMNDRKRKLSFQQEVLSQDGCMRAETGVLDKSEESTVKVPDNLFHIAGKSDACKFQEVENLDDDLFTGLDLDALEAEAAQKSRSKSNSNHSMKIIETSIVDIPKGTSGIDQPQFHCMSPLIQVQNGSTLSVLQVELKDRNEEFQFIPSFDLGIDR